MIVNNFIDEENDFLILLSISYFYVFWELDSFVCFQGTRLILMFSALMLFGNTRFAVFVLQPLGPSNNKAGVPL